MLRIDAKAVPHRTHGRTMPAATLLACLFAWVADAAQRDFYFEAATRPGDLLQQSVTDLAQDEQGFVWIATQGGLHRLDSSGVRQFALRLGDDSSLPEGFVTSIAPGEPGELWVGTRSRYLSRLDLDTGRFESLVEPGPGIGVIDLLHVPDQGLWIAAADRIQWKANGRLPVTLPAPGGSTLTPLALSRSPDGRVFLAARQGVFALDPNLGIRRILPGLAANAILAETDALLLATDDGLLRYRSDTQSLETVWPGPTSQAAGRAVLQLARDRSGVLWLALDNHGLLRLGNDYRELGTLREVPGLPGALPEDSIRALLLDRSGLLWVGGQMRGVSITDPLGARFQLIYDDTFGRDLVRGNSIRSILPDQDALWLGTDGHGLKRYRPGTEQIETFDAAFAAALGADPAAIQLRVHGLLRDGSTLWVSTSHGLLRFDPKRNSVAPVGAPDSPLRSALRHLYQGRDGTLWIGSNQEGLLSLSADGRDLRQFKPIFGDPESLSHPTVHRVLEDDRGRLWVGTDTGLNLLDRVTGKFQRFDYDPEDPTSLPGNRVRALHQDRQGAVWVGTHSGLGRILDRPEGGIAFERFDDLGATPGGAVIVFGILSDTDGFLWLATGNGIIRLDPSTRRSRRFVMEDGLQDVEFNGDASAILPDGRLAFGGIRGLNLFDPIRSNSPSTAALQPIVLSAEAGYDVHNRVGLNGLRDIRLDPDARLLRLRFGIADPGLNRSLRFRYRMDGLDDAWLESLTGGPISYGALPPGTYLFRGQARHLDGDWPESELALPVRVDGPWYSRSGAIAIFLALGLLTVVAVAVAVTKRRREEARLLAEIAQREERLTLALWGSGDEFWDWDIRLNRIFRLGADSLLGTSDPDEAPAGDLWQKETIHPDDVARVQDILRRHIAGELAYFESEHRVRNVHGDWIWVLSRGKVVERDHHGEPLRMAGTARDITQNRDAERERRIALEVLGSMSEAVAVTDAQFRFLSVNAAFSRMTGYVESEVIGQNSDMLDSSQHSPEFYRRLRRTVHEDGRWAGEMWQRRKDGEEFLGWIEINAVKDSRGGGSHFVAVVNDITDKKRAEQELRYLANYDTLTGLPNRALLSERLSRAIVKARRQNTRVAVLFLDLDRFKDINDSLGHSAGDRILRAAAARLLAIVGPTDTVARLGGDEFTVVLEDVESTDAIESAARRVLTAFSETLEVDENNDVSITPSIGISLYPDHAQVPTDLLKFADTAMYQAKAQGRNTFQFYTEAMDAEARHRATMAAALRRALDRGELRLLYQPRLALDTGCITGVEALLRWHSQELGEISPVDFIPLAEESGLILRIGEWVLREACITLSRWRKQGLDDIAMAVNVSVLQLLRGTLPEVIARTLREIEIPANRLELEVTESMVMANAEQTTATLDSLRSLGLSIAIDDFGTGYSSLVYLKRLPIDTLKIDKEFVGDLTHDPDDEAITATVISMAHSLGLNVVAEGVETQQQVDYLREQGCDEIQGYWLSRPMDNHHCLAFIKSWQPSTATVGTANGAIDRRSTPP